jgi:hypothetical protein
VKRPWRPAPCCCREGMRLLRLVAMGGTSFVFATASAAALSAASNPSPMPSAARILPLGDSLTLGVQGQGGGYRSPLGQALKGYGSAYNVGFVGGLYLAGDHSGYSGHTIGGILGAVKGARTMEINAPTHVLLLGGTNDFYFFPAWCRCPHRAAAHGRVARVSRQSYRAAAHFSGDGATSVDPALRCVQPGTVRPHHLQQHCLLQLPAPLISGQVAAEGGAADAG